MAHTTAELQHLKCALLAGRGCSAHLAPGLACSGDNTALYSCELSPASRDEAAYRCTKCGLGDGGDAALCRLRLKLTTASLEEALRSLWLEAPDYLCEWGELACVGATNASAAESFRCVWSDGSVTRELGAAARYEWAFLLVGLLIVAGGLGNSLVCLAVCLDKRLQNVTNYFLLSLAMADLLVSLFVMPMGAIPGFLGYWPLGVAWCNVYVTCDVLACSASIMHMCFISIGRYLGIRNPLKSRHHSTKRVVVIKIALVWLLSMTVSSSITVLGLVDRRNIMPTPELCVINNRLFWVFGSLVAFYVPMLAMVVSFALTAQLLRSQARLAAARTRQCGAFERGLTAASARSPLDRSPAAAVAAFSRGQRHRIGTSASHPQLSYANGCKGGDGSGRRARHAATQTPRSIAAETRRARPESIALPLTVPDAFARRFLLSRSKERPLSANAVANEQKATKVLGLVFFTFVLCWAPFFLLNVLFAACPACAVPAHVVDICLWLGYVSSTINPIIYTVFNRTFRAAFLRLLRCRCSRRGRCMASSAAAQLCARSALPLAALSAPSAPRLGYPRRY